MKRWTQLALLMSLAFNFGFLGSVVYRLSEKSLEGTGPLTSTVSQNADTSSNPLERVAERPDFKPEQRHRLQLIREKFHPRVQDIRQNLHQERLVLEALLQQASPDSIRIDAQLEIINQLQLVMDREIIFELMREAQILPPEQRTPFIQMALRRVARQNQPPGPFSENRPPRRLRQQSNQNNQRRNTP